MTGSTPLVSIVAVNFNNSNYVVDTLNSIASQNYPSIELIIVDDCSTDDSVQKIKHWLTQYNKPYKLVLHNQNKGVCFACNSGFKIASGKYIGYIATDDILLPEKLAIQVSILEDSNEKIGCVYSDTHLIKSNGAPHYGWFIQRYRQFSDLPTGNLHNILMEGNFIPGMSALFKQSVFEKIGWFDENLGYEDFDMWLRLSKEYHIVFSDFVSAKYRIHSNSIMAKRKDWATDNFFIYLKHADHPVAKTKLYKMLYEAYSQKKPYAFTFAKAYKNAFNEKSFLLKCILNKIPFSLYTFFKLFYKR
jgi:glycosyltransferase involved in cell wall biosynthesis